MPILVYIDMNAFFVSCHQAQNPKLKDKIVIVASPSRRAVVCSASYQAREYNIRSGMPLYQAKNLCPNATYLNVNRKLYVKYSQAILTFLKTNFTEMVEKCSIDEYCLDITDIYPQYGSPLSCAQAMQKQLLESLNLPCSIGISFTKELAKIASKLKKPQGIALIMQAGIESVLWPLAIDKLNGIGPKTTNKLITLNINTIGDLVNNHNQEILENNFGKRYWVWLKQAQGKTEATINFNDKKAVKSIGRDITLEYDSDDETYLQFILKKLTKQVVKQAMKKEVNIKTIVCGFKVDRSHWRTKQVSWSQTIDEEEIYQIVLSLFAKIWNLSQEVRALRVALRIKN